MCARFEYRWLFLYNRAMTILDSTGPQAKDQVVVGLSGGVDSTMAAVLLQERGCRVVCATMSVWSGGALPEGAKAADSCYSPHEVEDIKANESFCASRGIPFYVVDVRSDYQRLVLEYFKKEYRQGRTPNPCVVCNRHVKFGALLSGLDKLGVSWDWFCTGHYARVVHTAEPLATLYGKSSSDDRRGQGHPALIARVVDDTKDQSYFLHRIPSALLERVHFPLAPYTKREVVTMARERGLAAAWKAESQDFMPKEARDALFSDQPSVAGEFVDTQGNVLGRHKGIEHYTVGQRRGLGVCGATPLYVVRIDREANRVVLSGEEELLCKSVVLEDLVWPEGFDPHCAFRACVKVRAASKPQAALICPHEGGGYDVVFDECVRAASPGQSAVFYNDGVIIGAGIISQSSQA